MGKPVRDLLDHLRPHILPVGALAALTAVTYLSVFDPAVYMDDWDLFRKFIFGKMLVVNINSRRPFEDAITWLLFNMVGINPRAMFVAIVGLIFSCGVVVYQLIRRIFPRLEFLALPAALLFIIYPVDYTKVWMTRVYQWVIYLFVLLGILLLLEFLRGGRWWKLALALLLLLLPLGAYDGQMGSVALIPVLLAVFTPDIPLKRRILALSPLLGVAFLVVWRLYIQPVLLGFSDPYLNQASYSPLEMARRILVGFTVFAESWVKPFEYILPGLSPLKLLFILAGAVAAVVLIGRAGLEPRLEEGDAAQGRSRAA